MNNEAESERALSPYGDSRLVNIYQLIDKGPITINCWITCNILNILIK
jgi:hypothetical protein